MRTVIEAPEAVRRKASALGSKGRRWLVELRQIVAELESDWGIRVGETLPGGSSALVATATTTAGVAVVLKVSIPDGLEGQTPFGRELETLRLGAGHGYVRVLESDAVRRAVLQERLGRPLSALGLPVESQIDIIAATLRAAWCPLPPDTPLRTGAQQAEWLATTVRADWERLGRPCPERILERAEQFARRRHAAFDPATSVLIHGDAHPANILVDPSGAPSGFKLIDPDGMRSERAHDLAIPLRDWTHELLAGDSVALGLEWCARLSGRAAVSAAPIWEWAFLERVSTGLFMTRLGDPHGIRLLEVADRWTDVEP